MSKKLNEAAMQTELSGSAFFESRPATTEQHPASSKPVLEEATGIPPSKLPSQEAGKEGTQDASSQARKSGGQEAGRVLDLAEKPLRKNSFLFTMPEWEALEDLLLDLRRRHDLAVTKNDLARCALHALIEDYERGGDTSFVVEKLRGK